MTTERERLTDELREIEGSYSREITPAKQRRAREIIKILRTCRCRNCGKVYDFAKSRAVWTGFCTAKCLKAKSRELGYRPSRHGVTEYNVLKSANCVGNDYVTK